MRSEGFYVNEKSTDSSWDRTVTCLAYLRCSRPELLRRFKPSVMLHRFDWSIISAFRMTEGSSYSGVKQSKNTEHMHPYDRGNATVRKFGNCIPTRLHGILSQET